MQTELDSGSAITNLVITNSQFQETIFSVHKPMFSTVLMNKFGRSRAVRHNRISLYVYEITVELSNV